MDLATILNNTNHPGEYSTTTFLFAPLNSDSNPCFPIVDSTIRTQAEAYLSQAVETQYVG